MSKPTFFIDNTNSNDYRERIKKSNNTIDQNIKYKNYSHSKNFFTSNSVYKRKVHKKISKEDKTLDKGILKNALNSKSASKETKGKLKSSIYLSDAPSSNPKNIKNRDWIRSLSIKQRKSLISQALWIKNKEWVEAISSFSNQKIDLFSYIFKNLSLEKRLSLPSLLALATPKNISDGLVFVLNNDIDNKFDIVPLFISKLKVGVINKIIISYLKDLCNRQINIDVETYNVIGQMMDFCDKYYIARQFIYQKNTSCADLFLSHPQLDISMLEELLSFADRKNLQLPTAKARMQKYQLENDFKYILEEKEKLQKQTDGKEGEKERRKI